MTLSDFLSSIRLPVLAIAATAFLAGTSHAQQAFDAQAERNKVVATVNGNEITQGDIALAVEDFSAQLQQVPPQQRLQAMTDSLIDIELLAAAAREEGLEDSDYFKDRMEFLRARALRTAYLVEKVANSITEEEVRAVYQEAVKEFQPQDEVNARHILVKSKEEAEEIITQLNDGADFAELAREKSTGPTGPRGGDLGWFGKGRMVPTFDEAVFKLEPGQITEEPVETRFGWHVIKLEEMRQSQPPAFETVEADVRQELLQKKFEETIQALRDQADIQYLDERLSDPQQPSENAEQPQQ
jgi:peptidyl-prolyl cis-trans isomerase C